MKDFLRTYEANMILDNATQEGATLDLYQVCLLADVHPGLPIRVDMCNSESYIVPASQVQDRCRGYSVAKISIGYPK